MVKNEDSLHILVNHFVNKPSLTKLSSKMSTALLIIIPYFCDTFVHLIEIALRLLNCQIRALCQSQTEVIWIMLK